jgi:hypothetical protein
MIDQIRHNASGAMNESAAAMENKTANATSANETSAAANATEAANATA